jgi:hypothetical protein
MATDLLGIARELNERADQLEKMTRSRAAAIRLAALTDAEIDSAGRVLLRKLKKQPLGAVSQLKTTARVLKQLRGI